MKNLIIIFLGGMLTGLVSGCATNPTAPTGLHAKAQSTGGVKVLSAGLQADEHSLLVHGTVERELGYYGTPFRHLDVLVRGPGGERLAEIPVKFFPNPIPFSRFSPGRAIYTLRLAEISPAGSTILVAVDGTGINDCKPASTTH
jgi:hypothetical protein